MRQGASDKLKGKKKSRSSLSHVSHRMSPWVIGIDEVGRGALAGPVVVAVAMIEKGRGIGAKGLGKLKDSKKLSAKKRELWFAHFNDHQKIIFAIARIYPRGIERLNISRAANLAAYRACSRILASRRISLMHRTIYLDGGLFLGNGDQRKPAKTIIKGDEKITAIKIASIIAKVHRDRYMCRLAKKYPNYAFEVHKGYGTKTHRDALKKYGSCPSHRLTFLKKTITIK